MHENFDLENVVTPINHKMLNKLLKKAKFNKTKCKFLVDGFKNGFSLEYENPEKVQVNSANLKLTVGDEVDLWNKVMKEVKLKRYAGPFPQIPEQYQDDYIQSPIGLVSKDGGKDTRLIFHLSHPRRKVNGNFVSLNANTPSHKCKMAYPDFSEAILRCLEEGVNCHLSKSDVRSAFCQLGISKRFWRYLIMKARNPLDGKWYFFIDKCLPFGASISCALFQKGFRCLGISGGT